jgi:hypothetical protein
MVQRDDRRYVALVTGVEDATIVRESLRGDNARFGFDASPLNREAKGIESERGENVEVLFVAIP